MYSNVDVCVQQSICGDGCITSAPSRLENCYAPRILPSDLIDLQALCRKHVKIDRELSTYNIT